MSRWLRLLRDYSSKMGACFARGFSYSSKTEGAVFLGIDLVRDISFPFSPPFTTRQRGVGVECSATFNNQLLSTREPPRDR